MTQDDPDLLMAYAPYHDYAAQRCGPDAGASKDAFVRMDSALTFLLAHARAAGRDIAIVADYGFSIADRPVHIIRVLRAAGFMDIEVAANGVKIAMGISSSLPSAITRSCTSRAILSGCGRH